MKPSQGFGRLVVVSTADGASHQAPARESRVPTSSVASDQAWMSHVDSLSACLHRLTVTDEAGVRLNEGKAFEAWRAAAVHVRNAERVVYLMGNGASASMASHFAADLAKNAFLHTQVFTDISLITALANDLSYEDVFAEPLRRRMKPGDMVVAISSSGNSPNVIKACDYAAEEGAYVVTLSAMRPDNKLRGHGALNFWIPADTYGMAETAHTAILHYWMDRVSEVSGE